jgi:phenol 2-monooxygenase
MPHVRSSLLEPQWHTNGGIERTSFVPDVTVAARYKHEVTIHQGRIERIMEENLQLYSENRIQRSFKFAGFRLDAARDSEYPINIEVDKVSDDGSTQRRMVRAKYLVGADGAHSQVRRAMGLQLKGDTTDRIWGVVDFVAETNFPDIRKRCAIHSDEGSVMIILESALPPGNI